MSNGIDKRQCVKYVYHARDYGDLKIDCHAWSLEGEGWQQKLLIIA